MESVPCSAVFHWLQKIRKSFCLLPAVSCCCQHIVYILCYCHNASTLVGISSFECDEIHFVFLYFRAREKTNESGYGSDLNVGNLQLFAVMLLSKWQKFCKIYENVEYVNVCMYVHIHIHMYVWKFLWAHAHTYVDYENTLAFFCSCHWLGFLFAFSFCFAKKY